MRFAKLFKLGVTAVVILTIAGILFWVFEKSESENGNRLTQPAPQETFFEQVDNIFKEYFK